MSDVVNYQILEQGPRNAIVQLTDVSDGTGLANYVFVDGTSAGPFGVRVQGQTFYPGIHLKLVEIKWQCQGMGFVLYWGANANVPFFTGTGFGHQDFRKSGGIYYPQPNPTGSTGQVLLTTTDTDPNQPVPTFSVWARFTKGIPQN
jgi:hypothetical protein